MPERRTLVAVSAVIAAALLLPLVFLIIQAAHVGATTLVDLLWRHLTAQLLLNTVKLTVVVTASCALLGTGAAWLVERTDLPFRRAWAVLLVLPVAIPDFVVGYAWSSMWRTLHGLAGAAVVMTFATYPLVYLPVAAALRRADPGLEETARSLGLGRLETFWRVTLRQVRGALLGGCLIVALALFAEYGAFEIMRFQTFTTEIFTELNLGFDSPAACTLALVLVVLCVCALSGEGALNRGGPVVSWRSAPRPVPRATLGRYVLPALAGMAGLVVAALGVPVATIVYWMARGQSTTLPGSSVWSAASHTITYSAAAALVATACAVPVAVLAVRTRGRVTMLIERSTFVVQALPGLVIALSLVFFTSHYARHLYQTSALLALAYAVLFFPLALVCVRASVAQAPLGLEEMGRSLGRGRSYVLARITLPLVGPGLGAAFCLVFLSAATELTATLLLIPTGAHTLVTEFWAYQTNTSYGAAAPYAAIIVGIAAVPSFLLSRWFDRRPSPTTASHPAQEVRATAV